MKINNEEINIDYLYSEKYMHKEIKKGLFLSDYQIEVLMKYNIDPYKCGSISELIYLIDEVLDEEEADDLDIIQREIAEFNYYSNTNK